VRPRSLRVVKERSGREGPFPLKKTPKKPLFTVFPFRGGPPGNPGLGFWVRTDRSPGFRVKLGKGGGNGGFTPLKTLKVFFPVFPPLNPY